MLYEVLAGRQPFKGASTLATLRAILDDDPSPLEALNPASPPELRRVVGRCLVKDPGQRYQAAMDVARDLRAVSHPPAVANVDVVQPRASRRPALVWSVVGAAVLSAVAIGLWQRPDAPAGAGTPGSGIRVEKLTNRGDARSPAISSDGRYLAYASVEDTGSAIWLRDIAEKTETRLAGGIETELGVKIRFGQRGEAIYYSSWPKGTREWTLYKVPILGGESRLIAESLVSLSPDERHMAFTRSVGGKAVLIVAVVDTAAEREIGDVTGGGHLAWSQDGAALLFSRHTSEGHALFIVNADGTAERRVRIVAQEPHRAWWNAAGTAIVYTVAANANEDQLVGLDVATGETKPVGDKTWRQIDALYWLPAGDHFVATDIVTNSGTIWLVSYPDGRATRIPADTRKYYGLSMTADGTRLVTVEWGERSDVLVSSDPATGSFKKIVSGTDVSHSLCWTADGRIIYSSNEAGSYDLYVIHADGSNRKQLTFDSRDHERARERVSRNRHSVGRPPGTGKRSLSSIFRRTLRPRDSPRRKLRSALPTVAS